MQPIDFYRNPDIRPAEYSDDFLKKNEREIFYHQKDFKITYRPFFKTKRFFYLLQSHFNKKFFVGQASFSGLGDTVLYSHLPRLIKSHWPDYQVFVYETVYSKIVFANNPFIDGFTKDKQYLFKKKGSGSDYGSGHFTQMKARFLGIKECLPKGEIFISPEEKNRVAAQPYKPIVTFHAHGKSNKCQITDEIWSAVVKELKKTHYVIQLKSPEENMIEGVNQTVTGIRECIVQQSVAQVHVGVDSGFAHTAAALNVPAVIILDKINNSWPLLIGDIHQLVLPQLKGGHLGFLYPQHTYLCVGHSTPKTPLLSQETLRMAIDGKIYPFRKQSIWNMQYT